MYKNGQHQQRQNTCTYSREVIGQFVPSTVTRPLQDEKLVSEPFTTRLDGGPGAVKICAVQSQRSATCFPMRLDRACRQPREGRKNGRETTKRKSNSSNKEQSLTDCNVQRQPDI